MILQTILFWVTAEPNVTLTVTKVSLTVMHVNLKVMHVNLKVMCEFEGDAYDFKSYAWNLKS